MPIPTPATLREHYGADEFDTYDDVQITAAIDRARATVSRYVPDWPTDGTQAADLLDDCVIKGARAYVHDELRFPPEDPVIRDWQETLSWLRRVGSGQIRLPGYGDSPRMTRTAHASRTTAPDAVFTTDRLEGLQ